MHFQNPKWLKERPRRESRKKKKDDILLENYFKDNVISEYRQQIFETVAMAENLHKLTSFISSELHMNF